MKSLHPHDTLLAIVPATRGIGFAVVEARGRLVGWGFARLASTNDHELLQRVEHLTDKYRPRILCVEDAQRFRRHGRARNRISAAIAYASVRRIPVVVSSPDAVRGALELSNNATKLDLANAVADVFAELEEFVPAPRRIWEPESERTWVFRAAALAIATVRDG